MVLAWPSSSCDDGVAVHGHDQRAAHVAVLVMPVWCCSAGRRPPGRRSDDVGVAGLLHGLDQAQRDQRGDVDAAGLQLGDLGAGLADETVDQLVQLGLAAPVFVVARQGHVEPWAGSSRT